MARSAPKRVRIEALGVDAAVSEVGVDVDDGTIGAPDLQRPHTVGWFHPGPAPGEIGPSALVGHVDSRRDGAAVFYEIGALEPGDAVEIVREDGSTAVFSVDMTASYDKTEFPYGAVFADTGYAGLRLITCGGDFDDNRRSYSHNTVVYATLEATSAQADAS